MKRPNSDDYTQFLENDGNNGHSEVENNRNPLGQLSESFPLQVGPKEFRVLACSCFRNKVVSQTSRLTSNRQKESNKANAPRRRKPPPPPPLARLETSWRENQRPQNGWLTNPVTIAKQLLDSLPLGDDPAGLIVVSGSTGSGKSKITRGLICEYLLKARKLGGRRPHLITFEDPIETFFYSAQQAMNGMPERCNIDYTPREAKRDVETLADALKDALRQKPKVFFVGETRDRDDWKELIHFAGTGHMAVTTAHAGSVVESMSQILNAVRASTPAARSVVASRLIGVIHLRTFRSGPWRVTIPSAWRRTVSSQMNLVSDGLSSILPNRTATSGVGTLARSFFLEKIVALKTVRDAMTTEELADLRENLLDKTIRDDLEGQ